MADPEFRFARPSTLFSSASESASPFVCLVAATNFVYSAYGEHLAFALVPKAHIDAWRCEASFLHAALLVL